MGLAYIRKLRRYVGSSLATGKANHAGWIVCQTKTGTLGLQVKRLGDIIHD
jgi:hypothetical protein